MTGLRKLSQWTQTPRVILLFLAISLICMVVALVSMTIAWDTKTKETKLAQVQTAQAISEERTSKDAFCGFMGAIAGVPLPPNVSNFGKTISDQSKHAVEVLQCAVPSH